jgi:hypothetical protein
VVSQVANGCAAHALHNLLTLGPKACSLFALFTSQVKVCSGETRSRHCHEQWPKSGSSLEKGKGRHAQDEEGRWTFLTTIPFVQPAVPLLSDSVRPVFVSL